MNHIDQMKKLSMLKAVLLVRGFRQPKLHQLSFACPIQGGVVRVSLRRVQVDGQAVSSARNLILHSFPPSGYAAISSSGYS
jgi:hypothetical protein